MILIRGGLLDRETRVTKIIKALSDHGYEVILLCWDQGYCPSPRSERSEAGTHYKEIQFKLKNKWGFSGYVILHSIWWIYVFFWLIVNDWDIAHGVQITCSVPAIIAGKIKRKPVIYDILDVYEDSISPPRIIRDKLLAIDKVFMRMSSAIVLADEGEIEEVGGIPNSRVVTIYDSPFTTKEVDLSHESNEGFTLFFAGILSKKKSLNLDKIFKAIEPLDGVKVIIAGYSDFFGDIIEEIKDWVMKMPNKIQFIGEISHAEVLERSAKADALFVLRDSQVLVNKYICGSKILESMMCGRPIIVNKGTSTAKIVKKQNCGVIVDANNVEEIRNAITELKADRFMCDQLGKNGRKAYERLYSWNIMNDRLISLYNDLLNRC